MALRDQPYLPLYVQDFLTDEKLIECSASANGVYIRLMCIMHKSDEYGTILLRQKDKQSDQQIENFACKIAKQMPYCMEEIHEALHELLDEGVIHLKGDKLLQKRMLYDNSLSITRAKAGQKGGFATANKVANDVANTEYENEIENEVVIKNKKAKIKTFDFEPVWAQHPKKIGKKEAFGYFNMTVKTDKAYEDIKKAVDNYVNYIEKHGVEPKYIKSGGNWFSDWESWIDYKDTKTKMPKTRGSEEWKEPDYMKEGANG